MEGIEEARNMRKLDTPRIRPAISFKSFGAPTSETETTADGNRILAAITIGTPRLSLADRAKLRVDIDKSVGRKRGR
jgi:hypothetical protein